MVIAGSSSGRTHASEAWYRGSNPCPAVLNGSEKLRGGSKLLCFRQGFEDRSDARVLAKGERRAPRGAGCEKFPSGNLLVAESLPGSTSAGSVQVFRKTE